MSLNTYGKSQISLHLSLSLHFIGHFPGEPGLAGFIEAKDDGSSGDNWSSKSQNIFGLNL